jgi:hypothetical protein
MMELTPECRVMTRLDAIEFCRAFSANKGGMVYVASPYTHPDADVVAARYRRVRDFNGDLIAAGVLAFSPIAFSHQYAQLCGMGGEFAAWERFDFGMLALAGLLLVFMDDGWEHSVGVEAESNKSDALGLPVIYVVPDEPEMDGVLC